MESAVRTSRLSRSFGELRAVDDISLEVPVGTVFGLLGPNGSGKTTTIRMLLGLLQPTSGSAEVLGWDPRTDGSRIRRSTGALLEHGGLYERLSASENLELWGRIWGIRHRRSRVDDVLSRFGLRDRRGDLVGEWSRGMRQKLLIARAILHEPKLLFLDEPTAGLDASASVALRTDLVELASQRGTTVFLTTHNLAAAEKVCGLVALIRQGRLLAVGTPLGLQGVGHSCRVRVLGRGFSAGVRERLGSWHGVSSVAGTDSELSVDLGDDVDVPTLVRIIVEAGGEIEQITRPKRSLEDAYLAAMRDEGDTC